LIILSDFLKKDKIKPDWIIIKEITLILMASKLKEKQTNTLIKVLVMILISSFGT